ncbi:hypothetical protein, partial [Bartonella sp. AP58NXGY]|uniref:hypothetical protein n=1 Tax=Bartonella sp. AP58NXGY TaxID=3243498 RepID=UPI0035D11917
MIAKVQINTLSFLYQFPYCYRFWHLKWFTKDISTFLIFYTLFLLVMYKKMIFAEFHELRELKMKNI